MTPNANANAKATATAKAKSHGHSHGHGTVRVHELAIGNWHGVKLRGLGTWTFNFCRWHLSGSLDIGNQRCIDTEMIARFDVEKFKGHGTLGTTKVNAQVPSVYTKANLAVDISLRSQTSGKYRGGSNVRNIRNLDRAKIWSIAYEALPTNHPIPHMY